MDKLLSVVIPIFNGESYLERCLDSVCGQSCSNLEIICVNDGSSDSTGDILRRYAALDQRIAVIEQENRGTTAARKAGINRARGEYIAFVDCDDWIETDMFRSLLDEADPCAPDVIISQEIRDYGSYSVRKRPKLNAGLYENGDLLRLKQELVLTDRFYSCNVSPHLWDKIFKTELVHKWQREVPDSLVLYEDAAVAYPAIWSADSVYLSSNGYYHYCIRNDSMMATGGSVGKAALNDFLRYMRELPAESCCERDVNIHGQVDALCSYAQLMLDPAGVCSRDGDKLYPYGSVKKNDRVVLYGAGKFGVKLCRLLRDRQWFPNLLWVDSGGGNGAESAGRISWSDVDKVIVGALLWEAVEQIENEVLKRGVPKANILTADPLRNERG